MTIQFEGRELKSYAEPISADDLQEGNVYFSLQWADKEMLIPILEPLVFLGRPLNSKTGQGLLYFQSFESFQSGVRHHSGAGRQESDFHVRGPDDLKHIFEYERALDGLLKCSLRRRAKSE